MDLDHTTDLTIPIKNFGRFHFRQTKCLKIKRSEILRFRNINRAVFNSYASPKLLLLVLEGTVIQILIEMRHGLIEFVPFSRRCFYKNKRKQINYHFQRCYLSLIRAFYKVTESFFRNLFEIRYKIVFVLKDRNESSKNLRWNFDASNYTHSLFGSPKAENLIQFNLFKLILVT